METEPNAARAASAALLSRFVRYRRGRIDLSLGRIRRLLSDLGDPHEALPPVIHIAGTNGKGSTAAFLAAMLEAAGKRVSVYTSPHLVRFAERYRIAGELLSDEALLALLEEAERVNAGKPITEFELTTAAAFVAMARAPADAAILETGMGGRFDATNVVSRPAATVITPVALDHMAFLGDTLAAIAGEKAAIQKEGVPSAVGIQPPAAAAAIEAAAAAAGAPLHRRGAEWFLDDGPAGGGVYCRGAVAWPLPEPGLPGRHQLDNAALAAACLDACGFAGVGPDAVAAGAAGVSWPGRMQRLRGGALAALLPPGAELWLDVAHNPAGAACAADALRALDGGAARPLHLVFAIPDGKDAAGFLAPFAPLAASATAVPLPEGDDGLPAGEIAAAAGECGLALRRAGSLGEALRNLPARPPRARALVTGSHLLVGAALEANAPAGLDRPRVRHYCGDGPTGPNRPGGAARP